MARKHLLVVACVVHVFLMHRGSLVAESAEKHLAAAILTASEIDAGLCVHLGCGNGALTAELAGGGKLLVHGLTADRNVVDEVRRVLRAKQI